MTSLLALIDSLTITAAVQILELYPDLEMHCGRHPNAEAVEGYSYEADLRRSTSLKGEEQIKQLKGAIKFDGPILALTGESRRTKYIADAYGLDAYVAYDLTYPPTTAPGGTALDGAYQFLLKEIGGTQSLADVFEYQFGRVAPHVNDWAVTGFRVIKSAIGAHGNIHLLLCLHGGPYMGIITTALALAGGGRRHAEQLLHTRWPETGMVEMNFGSKTLRTVKYYLPE